REGPGQTLDPTGPVHKVHLHLVGADQGAHWESRGHSFAAAAEAMRRILVERARDKHRLKRGGGMVRQDLEIAELVAPEPRQHILALDDALTKLARASSRGQRLIGFARESKRGQP